MTTTTTRPRPATSQAPVQTDPAPSDTRSGRLKRALKKERWAYFFILPGLLYFVLFHYVPLLGNVVAFQDFSPFLGITGSEFVGLANFLRIVTDPEVLRALYNTLVIAFLQVFLAFPAPILLALFLNSPLSARLKRTSQAIDYLPHFISRVLVVAISRQGFSGSGVVAE